MNDLIKGAVYFPSRVYNAYQTYLFFDIDEIKRDFHFAQSAGINAIRLFTSYEYWCQEPAALWEKLDALLTEARNAGIKVMPILFENCGRAPTPENALSRDPYTAVCIQSPGRAVTSDEALWGGPLQYVEEFMGRYADDDRLIAIEVMNEPNEPSGDIPFARKMTEAAHARKGSIPLTIGCISLHHNLYFTQWIDVYQFHDNFPTDMGSFQNKLLQGATLQALTGKPVWLTEWQRIRTAGPGWNVAAIPSQDTTPDLASLAQAVYSSGLGSFFWSLMVKPAYLAAQRPNGTFNGLFHEDGSVYSIDDFKAIAQCGDQTGLPAEKRAMPEWFTDARNTKQN